MTEKKLTKAEKLAIKIATSKKRGISVPKEILHEIGTFIEKNYIGTVTWFAFGSTAHVYRDKKQPMPLRLTTK